LAHFGPLPAALTPDAAARELVAQTLLLVGAPYRWGGSRVDSGFDCSGLIRHVFAESLQWRLPGSAREQFRIGQEIDRDSLLPADLVFFSTAGSRASHVGLCIGPRRFVHAPNARGVVRIEEFRGNYWLSQFDGGRRLILRS
jgi:cell wall-associated NlpC family hydrolase